MHSHIFEYLSFLCFKKDKILVIMGYEKTVFIDNDIYYQIVWLFYSTPDNIDNIFNCYWGLSINIPAINYSVIKKSLFSELYFK